MKILMMHRSDGHQGGGQVQMQRLRAGLKRHGVDARVLCRERSEEDSVLIPARKRLERWLGRVTIRLGFNDIHLISSFGVPKIKEFIEADLVDIHSLHSETFSYLALPVLTAAKPVVFTFHDMWPLTGHCHACLECGRWKTGCGHCLHPEVYPPVRMDSTAFEWRFKRRAYERSKFRIVTPSMWLLERTKESMLGGFPVHHIPHGIDMEVFKPLDKGRCREILGIPAGKRVLICALESMWRPLKGAGLLVEALKELPDSVKRDCVLLLFGQTSVAILRQIHMPIIELGFLYNDHLKALAFSAADLFINPSWAESFGLVALESMACGTPTVSFRVGGLPELVRPGVTGFLAEPLKAGELAAGTAALLEDGAGLERMSRRCREIAVAEYSIELQVSRYMELYQQVIEERIPKPIGNTDENHDECSQAGTVSRILA
jgi:glycosyltransferase involved in cell wall biosynthesis